MVKLFVAFTAGLIVGFVTFPVLAVLTHPANYRRPYHVRC